MTESINLIAFFRPEFVDDCLRFARFTFAWGGWFIILAFIVAGVETVVTLWAKVIAAKSGQQVKATDMVGDTDAWTKFLEALAKLLETLTKLPAWVAIFLAGITLLWISSQAPKWCSLNSRIGESSGSADSKKDQQQDRSKQQQAGQNQTATQNEATR